MECTYVRTYVYRIGKVKNEECVYCGEADTIAHAIFLFNRWKEMREEIRRKLGKETRPNNLVGIMLESRYSWEELHKIISRIMKTKEKKKKGKRDGEQRIESVRQDSFLGVFIKVISTMMVPWML